MDFIDPLMSFHCQKLPGTNSKLKHSGNAIKHITSNHVNILESHIEVSFSENIVFHY